MSLKKQWPTLGIPMFASLAAPWVEKLINVQLISEYYQPRLSIFATILGPLFLMITYGLLKNASVASRNRWAIGAAVGLFVSFLICISFQNWIGPVWVPEVNAMTVVRILWTALYELMFIFLAVALGAGFLSARR